MPSKVSIRESLWDQQRDFEPALEGQAELGQFLNMMEVKANEITVKLETRMVLVTNVALTTVMETLDTDHNEPFNMKHLDG